MAGICTLNIGVFTELIDSYRLYCITQCKFVATCWTSCFDIASAARNSNFGGKHKTKSANKRSCNRTSDILSDILTFSAVFQRIQRHSAASNRTFRYIPSICNRSHGRAGCCHRRHSGRGSHYRIECCRICDDRRHSGRRSCYCLHVGVVGRIQTRSTSCVLSRSHARCSDCIESGRRFLDRRHSGIMRHKMPNF